MRSLVVDMVGMVGVCVLWVVCLVSVYGLEGVECVFVWRAMSDSGECCCWVGWVCGLGWGIWGERGKKTLITLWLLLKLRISGGSEFCFKNLY